MFGRGGDQALKGKYDELRREICRQEEEWSALQALLQRAVTRVSIAAAGQDSRMEPALDDIRRAVKGRLDAERLESGLGQLADAVKTLEDRPASTPGDSGPSPGELLAAVLRQVNFDAALREQLADTLDRLGRDPADREQAEARVVALLKARNAAAQHAPAAAEVCAHEPWAQALDGLMDRLELSRDVQARVLTQCRKSGPEAAETALEELARALAPRLHDAAAPPPEAAPAAATDLRSLLGALVQRIAGIPGLEGVARELDERLQDELELGEWPGLLDSLADALERVLESIRRQKAELEAFIGQVNDQLGRFQDFVRSSEADLDSARSGRERLSTRVGDEMQSLRAHVDGAGDVDELKGRVLGSLNQIAAQLQSFREHEESRLAEAEARNQRLVRQLDALGFEAKRLREENEERLEQLMLDPLTKVHSRFAYEKRLAEEFSRWRRHGQPLGFVIWDIDRFKAINDNYGHKVGDRLLQMVARLLARHTRQSDFLARIGGEEFVMLLPGAGAEETMGVAQKLRQVVADTGFHYRREPRPVTLSAGITEFREGDRPDDVYQRADAALYRAKEQGRNRCEMG